MTAPQQAGLALLAIAGLIWLPGVVAIAGVGVADWLADRRWRRG